jgi:CHAT domain-containing protein
MLKFHMSKFRLGHSYVASAGDALRLASEHYLRELYKDLFAPLERLLNCKHLVLIPNSFLHYLPLHALHDGQQFLIDRFTVSYSPSASIYALSQKRVGIWSEESLVFGIHDSKAPWILREVQEVSAQLPGSSLYLGADATRKVLEQHGAQSRFIHLATHGVFRTDNPMFSAVRLGDCYLNVCDLYDLHLPAELLTLSGCGTGQNAVAAGDELIGLARGLLHAGAHSLLLTLWEVHDRSTAEFMRAFYRNLRGGYGKAEALQYATQEIRERYPHPYYWAPFVLVGKT